MTSPRARAAAVRWRNPLARFGGYRQVARVGRARVLVQRDQYGWWWRIDARAWSGQSYAGQYQSETAAKRAALRMARALAAGR